MLLLAIKPLDDLLCTLITYETHQHLLVTLNEITKPQTQSYQYMIPRV